MPTYTPRLLTVLQRAVTVLRADSTLAGLLEQRVYTQAPQDIQLPLITLVGEERPWASTQTGEGAEVVLTVTAYSAQAGLSEACTVVSRAVEVLTTDSNWTAVEDGGIATLLSIDRPFAADLDGRSLTVQEARVSVRWGGL